MDRELDGLADRILEHAARSEEREAEVLEDMEKLSEEDAELELERQRAVFEDSYGLTQLVAEKQARFLQGGFLRVHQVGLVLALGILSVVMLEACTHTAELQADYLEEYCSLPELARDANRITVLAKTEGIVEDVKITCVGDVD